MVRAPRLLPLHLALASALAACLIEGGGLRQGEDGGCGPEGCPEGSVCIDGLCRPADDADGDGVPAGEDCDDSDPLVARVAERPCESACARGVELCEDGVWGPCSAPDDCACEGEETRVLPCERCGSQHQRCVDGLWVDDGGCVDQGECGAGEGDEETEACGPCELGSRSRTRACEPTCAWGAWDAWGECSGAEGACTPDEIETETRGCGDCGSQNRTRTCDADCSWGAWSDWSACSGVGECSPGGIDTETRSCGDCGSQNRTRTCEPTCLWGAWGDWSACAGEGECTEGAVEEETEDCGPCLSRSRSRTCEPGCIWGAWSSWTACVGSGECVTGVVETESRRCGICTGTELRTRICSASCVWGSWSVWGPCTGDDYCSHSGSNYCPCTGGGGYTCCPGGYWSTTGCPGC